MPFGGQSGEAVEGFFEQAEIGDGAHRLDLAGRVAAHQDQGEFVVAGKRAQWLRGGSAKADAGTVGAIVGTGRGAAGVALGRDQPFRCSSSCADTCIGSKKIT